VKSVPVLTVAHFDAAIPELDREIDSALRHGASREHVEELKALMAALLGKYRELLQTMAPGERPELSARVGTKLARLVERAALLGNARQGH